MAFYKSIFKETDDVWKVFEKRMKTSCTIVVLESYPMSSDTKYKRVVGAITFWYNDSSIAINMMGICEEDLDLSEELTDLPDNPC